MSDGCHSFAFEDLGFLMVLSHEKALMVLFNCLDVSVLRPDSLYFFFVAFRHFSNWYLFVCVFVFSIL